MKIIKGDITKINHIDGLGQSVVTIGNFDGMHTYHQQILRDAEKIANVDNLELIVVTFNESFKQYYTNENDNLVLDKDKINYFENYFGVDYYIELEVNKNLEQMNKKQFMVWLKEVLHTQKIVEGSDFTFGTNKEGTVKDLQEFFKEDNVKVIKRKAAISSTKIRQMIGEGKIDKANKALLRPLKAYLEPAKSSETMMHVSFPLIPIKKGYYSVSLNGKSNATVVIGDNNNVSIVDSDTNQENKIEFMILEKYLGATLN